MAASFSAHRIDDRRRSSVIVHWRRVNNTVGNGLVEAADVSLSFFLFFFMIIFLKRNDQETTVEFTKNHVFSITPPSFDGILMTRSRISSPPPRHRSRIGRLNAARSLARNDVITEQRPIRRREKGFLDPRRLPTFPTETTGKINKPPTPRPPAPPPAPPPPTECLFTPS